LLVHTQIPLAGDRAGQQVKYETMKQASQSATRGRSGKPNASTERRLAMQYVGLDVHARRSSLCILDSDGKTVNRLEVNGPWPKLIEQVERSVPRPLRCVTRRAWGTATCTSGWPGGP